MKIVFAGMATVAVSALGATAMVPTTSPAAMGVIPIAAIDASSDTIGFADSDLYGMTPAQIDQQLDQMQALGVNNVRIMIPWAGVEPYQGYYNWGTVDYMVNAADSRGMGVLGVLNSTPYWATQPGQPVLSSDPASAQAYGDFAGLVAQRYGSKVGAYEVWNEPNSAQFFAPQPDPAAYTALLKAAYPEIKAAAPNATVIGGVVGAVITYGNLTMNPIDFVNGIYAAGGEPYFDALSFHPYQYTTEFSQGGYLPDSPINQLTAIRNLMVANGDSSKLIWASEYGEPSSVAGEANQAAYLQDMLTTWRSLGYTGPAFVWSLQDRNTGSTDPEDNFGVIRTDGTLKPAAYVIAQLASQSTTTPAMARAALSLPDAQLAAPADLAALARVAAPQPQTPMGAVADVAATTLSAGAAVAASLGTLNPVTVAQTTLAAAGQVVSSTLQQANAMVMAAVPQTPAAVPAISKASPTAPPVSSVAAAATASTPSTAAERPAKAAKATKATESSVTASTPSPTAAAESTGPEAAATESTQSTDAPKQATDSQQRSADAPKRATDAPKHASRSDTPQTPRHGDDG